MTDRTFYVTLSKNGDGTIRMKGSCRIGGQHWVLDKNVNAKDVFDEMWKLTDHANNELGIGCAFDCE